MNCQDMALLLNDADLARLDQSISADLERHVATCADCAGQWRAQLQLVARELPDVPADLVARCRGSFASGHARAPHAALRRPLILGGLVALAAAAAIVGIQGLREPDEVAAPPVAEPPVGGMAVVPPAEAVAAEEPTVPAAAAPAAASQEASRAGAPPARRALPRFEVAPLQRQSENAQVAAAVEVFRAELLDAARQLEGFEVVDGSTPPDDDANPIAIRLTLRAVDSNLPGFQWQAVASAERLTGDRLGSYTTEAIAGSFDRSRCIPRVDGCARQAASVLEDIQRTLFPEDAALLAASRGRLADRAQPWSARRSALLQLLQKTSVGNERPLLDAELIRATVELAAAAPSPSARRAVWGMLRGFAQASLVAPLVEALGHEVDAGVKLEIAALLATDHAADPAAMAALEAVFRGEAREVIRMAVGQYLAADGAAAWQQYVTDALRDAQRPAIDRLEPFLLMQQQAMREPSYYGGEGRQRMAAMIDDESGHALASLLPGYWKEHPAQIDMQMLTILGYYSMTRHPAAPALLTEALRSDVAMLRNEAAHILDRYFRDEPGVPQALQEAAAGDPAIRRSLEFRAAGNGGVSHLLQDPPL